MLLLMGIAPQSTTMTWYALAILTVLFAAMTILLFRKYIFKRRTTL